MSCTEEGKTLKSVSACRFARNLQQQIGEVQSVNRQRNGTLLFEVRSDAQIAKIVFKVYSRPPGKGGSPPHLEPL